jgi:CIC family chloride channel protein
MVAAYAATLSPDAVIDEAARLADRVLTPAMGVRQILETFDEASADELAVVDDKGKVLGVLTEKHARRRYLEEIEADQRRMFGEM